MDDKSKVNKIGVFKLSNFEDVDYIITEKDAFDKQLTSSLGDASVEVIEV